MHIMHIKCHHINAATSAQIIDLHVRQHQMQRSKQHLFQYQSRCTTSIGRIIDVHKPISALADTVLRKQGSSPDSQGGLVAHASRIKVTCAHKGLYSWKVNAHIVKSYNCTSGSLVGLQ
jgi:hypothetical protein